MSFISAAPSGGSGGAPLPAYFISPAARGLLRGAGQGGNFSVGICFAFLNACTWTGVRFGAVYAGTKTWKARAYDLTAAAALASATSPPLASGTNDVLFGAPVAIPNAGHVYVASIYDTSGVMFVGFAGVVGPDNWTAGNGVLLGPDVYLIDASYFAAGDSQPVGGGSSARMAVEPIFTVP